ncbi:hypothetical protein ZHAS_00013131 [Anopheles sinensis]|uniref:Uncharacterized protein n=1 Tax=Anopheles sinensis TaxID=74873 RepID=A0A084W4M8_ANOSI|nr:hypothetical protein ZHAS_00013131 [Anopheles sinensis]
MQVGYQRQVSEYESIPRIIKLCSTPGRPAIPNIECRSVSASSTYRPDRPKLNALTLEPTKHSPANCRALADSVLAFCLSDFCEPTPLAQPDAGPRVEFEGGIYDAPKR